MEKRLYEASVSGIVNTLNALIQEDQLILDRVNITCFDETPLHIAALRGHLDFARALLIRKPELASELDASRRSPLHLASVQGNAAMVRELLRVSTDACLFRDDQGKIPLHLAAMKDRVEVVRELIQAQPESIKTKARRGETVLHLCVKHNRFDALKLLVELTSQIDPDLVSSKDEDGNTILHVAAALKQDETIKYLFAREGMEVIATTLNGNSFTALDLVENYLPKDVKAMEIQSLFLEAGFGRAKDAKSLRPPQPVHHETGKKPRVLLKKAWNKYLQADSHWSDNVLGNLMVVATLTATMAFQAGINPPGGVWQDDKVGDGQGVKGHKAGTSVLADDAPELHKAFMICNAVSFVASLSVILLLIIGFPMKNKHFIWLLTVAMCIAVGAMALTYIVSLDMITPEFSVSTHTINNTTITYIGPSYTYTISEGSLYACFSVFAISILLHSVRFFTWLVSMLRKNFFKWCRPNQRPINNV